MLPSLVAPTAAEAFMKRCAHCGGRLGLIAHRTFSLRFCKLACKKAYGHKAREEVRKKISHLAVLTREPTRS